jgi:hypothetical protein
MLPRLPAVDDGFPSDLPLARRNAGPTGVT